MIAFIRREGRSTTSSTEDEIRALLAAVDAKAPHVRLAIAISLHTGLRKSEVLGLAWSDVDFTNRRIIIEEQNGQFHVVPMDQTLISALTAARAKNGTDVVFPSYARDDIKHELVKPSYAQPSKRQDYADLPSGAGEQLARCMDILEGNSAMPGTDWHSQGRWSTSRHRGAHTKLLIIKAAPVAQLDRASDFESAGREFESPRARSVFRNGSRLRPGSFVIGTGRVLGTSCEPSERSKFRLQAAGAIDISAKLPDNRRE